MTKKDESFGKMYLKFASLLQGEFKYDDEPDNRITMSEVLIQMAFKQLIIAGFRKEQFKEWVEESFILNYNSLYDDYYGKEEGEPIFS